MLYYLLILKLKRNIKSGATNMQKVIAILQIKGYNYSDFAMWLKWYTDFIKCDEIAICDDNSAYDLKQLIEIINPDVKYWKRQQLNFKNAPGMNNDQVKIYNHILQLIKPNKDDIILLPDDDEFFWYDTTKFSSFAECANFYRMKLNTDAVLVPWTLMRSKEIIQSRKLYENFADCFNFRTNIDSCEHKPIMFYKGLINTTHHNGYTNGKPITEFASNKSIIFSKCKYDLPLRCYHYRFTTIDDYKLKMSSDVAMHIPRTQMGYSKDFRNFVKNNINQNGSYDIEDLTVKNELAKLG